MTEPAEAMFDYIKAHPCTSMVELERIYSKFGPINGDHILYMDGYENIAMWLQMSEGFAKAVEELLDKVKIDPASLLVYAVDGKLWNMPLAKNKRHYKKLRWCPVTLSVPPQRLQP